MYPADSHRLENLLLLIKFLNCYRTSYKPLIKFQALARDFNAEVFDEQTCFAFEICLFFTRSPLCTFLAKNKNHKKYFSHTDHESKKKNLICFSFVNSSVADFTSAVAEKSRKTETNSTTILCGSLKNRLRLLNHSIENNTQYYQSS